MNISLLAASSPIPTIASSMVDGVRAWDERVFEAVNRFAVDHAGKEIDFFMRAASEWGAGYTVGLLAIAVALSSSNAAQLHGRLRRLIAGLILVAVAVRLLKKGIGRSRPHKALTDSFTDGTLTSIFDLEASRGSFPSGHSATIFCAAVLLIGFSTSLPAVWRRTLGGIILVLASLAAFARVYAGAHFPSDVIAGALLGSMIAVFILRVFRVFERRHARTTSPEPRI